ncbi:hypothetical protein NUU61_005986 [Penicillium alfredii]|uniref:TauD/TfdA-like domain-containing protein n=1 Tax=Penicillium alfredii TaxID=1506179 RepID=A0A9W9F089_9EURO|nr:uncharacterized protein NUU61_005986 [Penicillium alfredii]KAJ5091116.1 hypothetical protein NUU61_005986 [Penicillium alfredii]
MHRPRPSYFFRLARGFSAPSRSFVATRHVGNAMANLVDAAKAADIASKPELSINPELPQKVSFTNSSDNGAECTLDVQGEAGVELYRDAMTLSSETTGRRSFPYHYLRDLCRCPKCVDPHSKQRSFRTSDIPKDIAPRHVKWDGERLEVQWSQDIPEYPDSHTSSWDYQYLKRPFINTHAIKTKSTYPLRWGSVWMQRRQHWISYQDYMENDVKFAAAMRNLSRMGLIFVKNIPESREMVEKLATRMGPLRNSFYGPTWDVRTVPEAKNVAYTNQFLGFHMDLMYMNEPPGYQLLHCLENSCEGGESLFADAFRAADIMSYEHPRDFQTLTRHQLGYEYIHDDQIYYNHWPVFDYDRKINSMRRVNYSPPFQSPLPPYSNGEHTHSGFVALKRALTNFTRLLESDLSVFELKLNPGECAIFANRRVVHARRQFNMTGGSRWLAGAYVDEDALLSRFAVCQKKHPITWRAADPMADIHSHRSQKANAAQAEKTVEVESVDAQPL